MKTHTTTAINPQLKHKKGPLYSSIKAHGRQLDDVYALRYRAYFADGYIESNNTERFFDRYDHLPKNFSYLTYYDGEIAGSIRASLYDPKTPYDLPAMEIYSDEIRNSVGLENSIVESNKFVIAPEFQRRGGLRLRLALVLNMVNAAVEHHAPTIITAVRKEHLRLYKSFSFEAISKAKKYPLLKFETVLLACYDVQGLREYLVSKLD